MTAELLDQPAGVDVSVSVSWPEEPYKGVNYYESTDALLFCERDEDVDACGSILGHSAPN
jgi:hypothetical protein